jgi:alkylation response protein AidB-like acyl-CoA dehydrogenase
VVNGRKIYISRVDYSDLMILLARTTPMEELAEKRTKGLSVFLLDLRDAAGNGLTVKPRRVMMNNATNELLFEDVRVPARSLIGEEGEGFRYVLDGMNAERILIAAECIGDGRFFVEKASARAKEREVFGRPIGQNQGVQFPIAWAYARVEAASLMVERAASLFDRGEPCGAEANLAKLLAADASWEAANVAVQTFGGYGFDAEYGIERKFRETRLYQVAPISTNLILSHVAEHVLGLPRSF